jgi:uncharacterized membrane protein SpoIIM required for sporulation/uncharacterized RDD family membrane protein YckC
VALDYELAGLGSRLLAALADLAILLVITVVLFLAGGFIAGRSVWGQAVAWLLTVAFMWSYFALFEGFYRGQTPGKKWVGLRVIRDTGHPIGLGDAALRNLLRAADAVPPPFLLGILLIAFHPKAKRLGDLIAGTVVVRDRPGESVRRAGPPTPADSAEATENPELTEPEFRVLEEFVNRAPTFSPEVRARFADRLVARFAPKIPAGQTGPDALRTLLVAEVARRQGRFGARRSGGGAADRFAEQKRQRWTEFHQLAETASHRGLDSFPPAQLLEFSTRYREAAADLARARTYGVEPGARAFLERAVSAGHNALYRGETPTWRRIARFFGVECPAAVVAARWAVALGFLVFALPAALGYRLLRDRPDLAAEVLPQVMLERAAAGVAREQDGKSYYEATAEGRPLMAASIIANNVQVALMCFAGGALVGLGSLVILATNGLSIGAASGHFANQGLIAYLWTFIAGHGLLELFAIWVSGAAGFQLGTALIAPGRLPRREALVTAGRLSIRLVGCAVVLLLVAGLIEGLISAGGVPGAVKIGVSAASAALLALYLATGSRLAGGAG